MRDITKQSYNSLPFQTELSFAPLYRKIKEMLEQEDTVFAVAARKIIQLLERDGGIIDRPLTNEDLVAHAADVRLLMQFVFPGLEDEDALCKAYEPYNATPFFSTTRFKNLLESDDVTLSLSESVLPQGETLRNEDELFAYTMLYDIHYEVEHTIRELVLKAHNKVTRLDRYFTINYSFNYVDVRLNGLEIIPKEQFTRLLIMSDLKTLKELMPLNGVTFSGFIFARYQEVTERANISQLKSELVERDALNDPIKFERIVQRIRSVLQLEDLNAGLGFHYRAIRQNDNCMLRSLFRDFPGGMEEMMGTVYGTVFKTGNPLFVPNVSEKKIDTEIYEILEQSGIKSMGFIPLKENGKTIATLELTSSRPEMINSNSIYKLADLLPVLSIAVRQEMDEFESRIERTIKAHCTAIHPSVEWRFVEAATRYLNSPGDDARFENIEFEEVYPLYGSMDIRSSSEQRNRAIQADLLEHIQLASETLQKIICSKCLPLADYHHSKLQKIHDQISSEMDSGDEISVLEYLHTQVEPFLENVRDNEPVSSAPINAYFEEMNPLLGTLYQRRKDYEASVTLINESLSRFLDEEEVDAQDIFPHYFEKYRTDGVEYNAYVGQSMVKERHFESVQLMNLRLWQLKMMCRMTRLAESLTSSLPNPLACAPLILAHSTPLTIQFRVDEKQFEVEGSYNVRYEIIKKRIDKSTIRGTDERLTQPGMLAVIYTQEKEREEYEGYLEYLTDKGYVKGEVEHLMLEDLQGVHGLRALRVNVVLD
ncbi:GAF domain-containing protein [Pseudodesulfovibrio sp. zrk46]|uniref:GAF domain-containing protein n=1 Tax=Pseudodesulfovibrio sp. zrk46 TaxID=2725288 RepID=UPI001449F340|nr:GAF domain-containing protein [Pseudodesulfovibrio sp. zrk46]QJB57116.1 GAF domain-containing protein [Pseudodesulfovibrio sp. zrk46]